MIKNYKIIHDKYSRKRGGKSYLSNIYCEKCKSILFVYQKDGKGDLIRCYLDRFLKIDNIYGLNNNEIKKLNSLKCKKCNSLIAKKIIYKPENREAFHMEKSMFFRKIYKKSS